MKCFSTMITYAWQDDADPDAPLVAAMAAILTTAVARGADPAPVAWVPVPVAPDGAALIGARCSARCSVARARAAATFAPRS